MDTTCTGNKEIALLYSKYLHDRNFELLPLLFAPDATWFVMGNTKYVPYGGTLPAKERIEPCKQHVTQFDTFTYTVLNITAEEDRVITEAVASGSMGNKKFDNIYMKLFVIENGKIKSIREYMDNYAIVDYISQ